MLYHTIVLLLGTAVARNVPSRRDEWQAPATCFYLASDAGWKGTARNFCQTPSYCVNTLPVDFQGNISSAGPDEGQTCFLYSAENCKGDQSPPIIYPGESDLSSIGFNDKARSFRCWVMCGYVEGSLPPQSSIAASSSPSSSTSTKASTSTSNTAISITTTINGNITDVIDITVTVPGTSSAATSTSQPVSISQTPGESQQPLPKVTTLVHTYADGSLTTITTTLPAPSRA